jgi:hypothetical protein
MTASTQETSRLTGESPSARPSGSVDWQQCPHDWRPHFGTIKQCQKCGATVAVSMDGHSKAIWPPLSEWMDGLIPPNDQAHARREEPRT